MALPSIPVAATPRSFRLSQLDLKRLERLSRRLDRSRSEIVSAALVHLLSTIERDGPVWITAPSENGHRDLETSDHR
jgi:hypothetical protein